MGLALWIHNLPVSDRCIPQRLIVFLPSWYLWPPAFWVASLKGFNGFTTHTSIWRQLLTPNVKQQWDVGAEPKASLSSSLSKMHATQVYLLILCLWDSENETYSVVQWIQLMRIKLTSHITVCFESSLLCFSSRSLLLHTKGNEWWHEHLGPCHVWWKTKMELQAPDISMSQPWPLLTIGEGTSRW